MKLKSCGIICIIFSLLVLGFIKIGFAQDLSPYEKENLALIPKIKDFEKTFGFKDTENFKQFNREKYNKGNGCSSLLYQKKTEIAFSYLDPIMTNECVFFEDINQSGDYLKPIGKDPNLYDIYLYNLEASAGGAKITKRLLNSDHERLVYVVIHEDCHDNFDLPLHMEEAACDLIGQVAMRQFIGKENEIGEILQKKLSHAVLFNITYGTLSIISVKLANGSIDIAEYNKIKGATLIKFQEDFAKQYGKEYFLKMQKGGSMAVSISYMHSYSYYFSLMAELFKARQENLKEFVSVLHELPTEKINWTGNRKLYFDETRKRELELENKINEIIKHSSNK